MISRTELRSLVDQLSVIESVALMQRAVSTNDIGKRAVDECLSNELELPTSLIVATEQTAGRGRGANQWSSPPGGIYATVLQSRDRDDLGLVPMEIAVAVASFLRTSYSLEAEIKWPNDIMVRRRKIAGILAEAKTSGELVYLTIGIGLNVASAGAHLPQATSLHEEGVDVPLDDVISRFILSLDSSLTHRVSGNETLAQWRAWSMYREGDEVRARVGSRTITGLWQGIDDYGRARIASDGTTVEITSGEIVQSQD